MSQISIPWWTPLMGKKEHELIKDVLNSNFPNEGKYASEFEQKIAKMVGAKHAIAVTSGTAALFLSLKALGIGQGDEVIVPDITFIATANAVDMAGAKPILCDVDPTTMNLSAQAASSLITKDTKAIIPVHVTGRGADMASLMELASAHNLSIVEDAAEAFLSKHRGKFLGTYGEAGCFSFSPNKIITTGQGGIIVTNDDDIHSSLRELKDQGRPRRGTGGDDIHHSIGYNFKFSDLQAAVGVAQLSYVNERMRHFRTRHELYIENLSGIKGLQFYPFDTRAGELPLWTDALIENRDELEASMRKSGIDSRKFWHPLHTQAPYRLSNERFTNSTKLSPKSLWLPSAFTLSESQIQTVCSHIKTFYSN